MIDLETSIRIFTDKKKAYFKQWTFEKPFKISKSQNKKIEQLQQVLHKLITIFVTDYDAYEHLMPVSNDVKEILNYYKNLPYSVGTYRTDFVYTTNMEMKIIEISCRCSLNAMIISSVFNELAVETLKTETTKLNQPYNNIYNHLSRYLTKHSSIYVLQGVDTRNESKDFKSVFERMGKKVVFIKPSQIEEHLKQMETSWIITELSFDEILSIPKEIIKQLVDFQVFNDLRTVFLIHDKRFFSAIQNNELLKNVLTQKEINLFHEFYVPTYSSQENSAIWEQALLQKNK